MANNIGSRSKLLCDTEFTDGLGVAPQTMRSTYTPNATESGKSGKSGNILGRCWSAIKNNKATTALVVAGVALMIFGSVMLCHHAFFPHTSSWMNMLGHGGYWLAGGLVVGALIPLFMRMRCDSKQREDIWAVANDGEKTARGGANDHQEPLLGLHDQPVTVTHTRGNPRTSYLGKLGFTQQQPPPSQGSPPAERNQPSGGSEDSNYSDE